MESTTSSHEVLVCQTCGDKGIADAYVYCVNCLEFVIHRYCLKVMPKSYDEIVYWFCEDCQQPRPGTSHKLNQKQNPTNSQQLNTVIRKKRTNKRKKKTKFTRFVEKKDEVIFQEEIQQVSQPIYLSKDFRLKPPVLALEAQPKKVYEKKREESVLFVKMNENKTEKTGDSVEHSGCDSSCTDVNLKNKTSIEEAVTSPEKFHSFGKAETANEMHNEQEIRGGDADADADADATQSTLNNNEEYNGPPLPVQDPVWRGSFDITETDYNLFEGFVGHLSNRAHYLVCQEANVLPSLLTLEMHPKMALWPKRFLESQPSLEDIALYFFPGDTNNERDYEELVSDMLDEDLAMKAQAKNAELLIFTSRVLPRPFWRFQGKNYLWGIFKGKLNNDAVSNNPVLSENSPSEVTSGKETLTKVKTFDSQSPESPLCDYR